MIEMSTIIMDEALFNLIYAFCTKTPITQQFVNIKPLLAIISDIKDNATANDEFDVRYRYNKHFFSTLFPDYSNEDIELFALYSCALRINFFNSDAIAKMEEVVAHTYPDTKFYNYMQYKVTFMLMQLYILFGRKDDATKLLEILNTKKVGKIDFNNI